jgi:hypothetical protein
MSAIPREVLSEHFQKQMEGHVLKTGVFLTFRFDPGFFEQEILPVFLDVPLSHEPPLRLVQLEDAVRERVDHLAVYYDPRGVEARENSAKLDVRRIPVSWPTGYFHSKNVLLLVEDAEADNEGKAGATAARRGPLREPDPRWVVGERRSVSRGRATPR